MLLSMLRDLGFEAIDLGLVEDSRDTVRNTLNQGAECCDLIITSGGASAGDEDHISAILKSEGQLTSWRIALKPGRPLALGVWEGTPVIGLPGNPVAAWVCTMVFGRPAMEVLAGVFGEILEAMKSLLILRRRNVVAGLNICERVLMQSAELMCFHLKAQVGFLVSVGQTDLSRSGLRRS